MKRLMWVLLLMMILPAAAMAQHDDFTDGKVDLIVFSSAGCPYCAKMETFLEKLADEEPKLRITKYELRENVKLFFDYAERYGLDVGNRVSVPVVFIHEKVLVGYNKDIEDAIIKYVDECIEYCESLPDNIENVTQTIGQSDVFNPGSQLEKLTIPAVLGAAAVDAINPCAFAVLIILMTTILATKSRIKALLAGIAFSASIFIAYFLMGLGLFSAIQAAGVTRWFYIIVGVLAVLVGLFNLKDYFAYGKWFIMEVPPSWRPKMKAVIKGVTSVPGAFLVGFVVSLFLLPCTSGPYIVILGLLAHAATRAYAVSMLLLYNLIFILPMLLITGMIYFGFTTTHAAEEWRTRKLKVLHLIAGVIILIIGIIMLAYVGLGYV